MTIESTTNFLNSDGLSISTDEEDELEAFSLDTHASSADDIEDLGSQNFAFFDKEFDMIEVDFPDPFLDAGDHEPAGTEVPALGTSFLDDVAAAPYVDPGKLELFQRGEPSLSHSDLVTRGVLLDNDYFESTTGDNASLDDTYTPREVFTAYPPATWNANTSTATGSVTGHTTAVFGGDGTPTIRQDVIVESRLDGETGEQRNVNRVVTTAFVPKELLSDDPVGSPQYIGMNLRTAETGGRGFQVVEVDPSDVVDDPDSPYHGLIEVQIDPFAVSVEGEDAGSDERPDIGNTFYLGTYTPGESGALPTDGEGSDAQPSLDGKWSGTQRFFMDYAPAGKPGTDGFLGSETPLDRGMERLGDWADRWVGEGTWLNEAGNWFRNGSP